MTFTIADCPSPNHGERAGGTIDILLLHYTGMANNDAALRWLCTPESQVSCHYFVHEDGRVLRLVPEERRAWHAGAGSWKGRGDINSRSIGIEIANPGHPHGYPDFPDVQIEALIRLAQDILSRHAIPPEYVLAHSDTAPGRKIDPGEKFPWERLAREGVGHWVAPDTAADGAALAHGAEGAAVRRLQQALAGYGYEVALSGDYDAGTERAVGAFQRHFRPACVDGIADLSTRNTLEKLIAALGLPLL